MARRTKEDMLVRQARAVLDFNWTGEYTMPGPRLYPHQWSWDSAFTAIGYCRYDQDRATRELRHLFEAQWKNGLLPQLVFNPQYTNYFSRTELLACQRKPRRSRTPRDLRRGPAAHSRHGSPLCLQVRRS
jgi:hypothetical protein